MSVTIMRITCTRYTQCYNYYNYANTTLCYPPLTSLTSTLKPNPPPPTPYLYANTLRYPLTPNPILLPLTHYKT